MEGAKRGGWGRRYLFLIILGMGLLTFPGGWGSTTATQQRRSPQRGSRPIRLVVAIVIDQFRYDFLTRFENQYVEGGLKRFLTRGANFTDNNYLHTPTYTAPGHATLMTGTTPALNGIIGNEWFDRETGKVTTSVADPSVELLGGRGTASSPHRLIGTTLGDELKLTTGGRAKVIGISFKDRSAILPVGKRPDGAYWFDGTTGNFVSSSYYFEKLPDWVERFNQEQHTDRYFDRVWERLLPESAYDRSAPDDTAYEGSPEARRFPHLLRQGEEKPGPKFYGRFQGSPFANDHLIDLARAAVENEQLGMDDTPDLLTISFSANDAVGHTFGPFSQEVHDITLRTDRNLADLFAYLDRKIGLDHVLFALTADHGVAPVPEMVSALGYGGRVNATEMTNSVEKALNARFGEEKWILSTSNGNVYFDEKAIERRQATAAEVEQHAAHVVMQTRGIAACFTRTQILSGQVPNTHLAQSVVLGFHPQRNGNLVIVTEPFYLYGKGPGTSHGTPYSYDTHVPLLLLGPGVRPGWYHQPSSPADIAPTIATLLKISFPSNRIGRVLVEALPESVGR
jgi:predicted AlkP superfamily pyrophosphatase or phosphodiesterase